MPTMYCALFYEIQLEYIGEGFFFTKLLLDTQK